MKSAQTNAVQCSPLQVTYGLVPIPADRNKFFRIPTDWEVFLPSFVIAALPVRPSTFMIIGVVEVIAGLAVLTTFTRWGASLVMVWLTLIAFVAARAGYRDIVVRDLVVPVGAHALGRFESLRREKWIARAEGA